MPRENLHPGYMLSDLEAMAMPRKLAGVSRLRTRMSIDRSFEIDVSEHIGVHCNMRVLMNETQTEQAQALRGNVPILEVTPVLNAEAAEGAKVSIYIPEWNERKGARLDMDQLTLQMASGVPTADLLFPVNAQKLFNEQRADYEQMHREIHSEALEWLLGRMDQEHLGLDLGRMRIKAGDDIFDGTGRLLATSLRMDHPELEAFVAKHGIEAFEDAMEGGHVHLENPMSRSGKPWSVKKMKQFRTLLTEDVEARAPVRVHVRWDGEIFDRVAADHLSEVPFGGAPGSAKIIPTSMLEARLGLETPAPDTDTPEP